MPKRKNGELTIKEKKVVNVYLKTGNKAAAGRSIYPTTDTRKASAMAHDILKKPVVQSYMADIMDAAGLSDEALARDLRKTLMKALSKSSFKKVTPGDGLRAIEMAFRLKDRFPAERKQIDKRSISMTLAAKDDDGLKDQLSQILQNVTKMQALMSGTNQS